MDVFTEISMIIGVTVLVSGVIKMLRQPLIIGYILSGIALGPYFLNLLHSTEIVTIFSKIGIALLLFIIGLNLSPRVIKEVGKISLITGVGQIVFTSIGGFILSMLLGFSALTSAYIAIALTFSSTIIIMKLLSDKKDLEKLYGKISIGFLLVQDFFVIILLMLISSFSGEISPSGNLFELAFIGIFVTTCIILISVFILPKLSNFFAKSQEFLFLFSIAWALGLSALFYSLGFSIEIGALIAGIVLSMSPYHFEISSKMRPLRDFFIIMFFVLLGSQMILGEAFALLVPALLFSVFILVGNPLIVIALMGFLGYRKKTGFQAGFTVAQISEFSLIFAALGVTVGHISREILSLITLVGLITISASTYLILYSDRIYPFFSGFLSVFERKRVKEKKEGASKDYDVILFGCDRIGSDILHFFSKKKKSILVVDYNPRKISELSNTGIDCKYGDAEDDEFLNELNLENARMIISTVPDYCVNSLILSKAKRANSKAIIIAVSYSIKETENLYNKGATYVIMPHFLGGREASKMIYRNGLSFEKFIKEKEKHLKWLETKRRWGHEHPKPENHR